MVKISLFTFSIPEYDYKVKRRLSCWESMKIDTIYYSLKHKVFDTFASFLLNVKCSLIVVFPVNKTNRAM